MRHTGWSKKRKRQCGCFRPCTVIRLCIVLLLSLIGLLSNVFYASTGKGNWISIDSSYNSVLKQQVLQRIEGERGAVMTHSGLQDAERTPVEDNPDRVSIRQQPTHDACAHSDGIFHISIADIEGGVGTALFQLIIAQLSYAESLNLTPWVHLIPNISHVIDDPVIHHYHSNGDYDPRIAFTARVANVTRVRGRHRRDVVPGPLDTAMVSETSWQKLRFGGTGIWGHYMQPVSDFVPGDASCADKLYVTLDDMYLVIPGLHGYSTHHAVHCWRYDYLPSYVSRPHQSYHAWIQPSRQRGADLVARYFRYRPYIVRRAEMANPDCHKSATRTICLGLHIRHSDKAAGRRVVAVSEFLPYAQALVESSRRHDMKVHIYVATDSSNVVHEIQSTWPSHIVSLVRTESSAVRTSDTTAVFDATTNRQTKNLHHATNQDAIVEILALSYCRFMIHGHSAVSEAAVWNNVDLHDTSVNLEDGNRLDASQFGTLVDVVVANTPKSLWPRPVYHEDTWPPKSLPGTNQQAEQPTQHACDGYNGILLISTVGKSTRAAGGFFRSVLDQLLYADRYNLKPWIHLTNTSVLFDEQVHDDSRPSAMFTMMRGMIITPEAHENVLNSVYPSRPTKQGELTPGEFIVPDGNGIWTSYFEPASDFVPGDLSCRDKPLIEMTEILTSPGARDEASKSTNSQLSRSTLLNQWTEPTVNEAHEITKRYFRLRPYILERAREVNPDVGPSQPCMGIHVRMQTKQGKGRRKAKPDDFLPYIEAFAKAGGRTVYVAADAERPLRYMTNNFPPHLTKMFRTQGDHIVRLPAGDAGTRSTHELDNPHRINSETLVDIVSLSRCAYMVHGESAMSDAAMYLNPILQSQSVNLEDSDRMSPESFELLVRGVTGRSETMPQLVSANAMSKDLEPVTPMGDFQEPRVLHNQRGEQYCRSTNAIIYLVQKVHSSYSRDSFSSLLRSLELLTTNYISIDAHAKNVDVFIFHTGDFNSSDLTLIESTLGQADAPAIYLVDLSSTTFWARPKANANDDPKRWYAYPLFSEGYRRMMHWFAIDVWDFFAHWNDQSSCEYRYIWRLDEDSFIHSPITYDVFDLMISNRYVYGFRMCAYEMKVTRPMSTMWLNGRPDFQPKRQLSLDMCGFYNNFFVADLQFFRSAQVSEFLAFIDKRGHIYKRRLGDLMIHSMAVYWFADEDRIHRFLDFTYEHGTRNHTNGCLQWGGIQAGYDDVHALKTLTQFRTAMNTDDRKCDGINVAWMNESDLSPTYAHVPSDWKGKLWLQTITAGAVELPTGKGLLSG